MAQYRAEEVAELIVAEDYVAESDSELDEDPAFPLPTVDSDEELPPRSSSPVQPLTTPQRGMGKFFLIVA